MPKLRLAFFPLRNQAHTYCNSLTWKKAPPSGGHLRARIINVIISYIKVRLRTILKNFGIRHYLFKGLKINFFLN
jgi:hypothetical protein